MSLATRLPVFPAFFLAVFVGLAGCGGPGPDRLATDPAEAVFRLEIDECGGATQVASAFGLSGGEPEMVVLFSAAHPLEKAKALTIVGPGADPVRLVVEPVLVDPEIDITILRPTSADTALTGLELTRSDRLVGSQIQVPTVEGDGGLIIETGTVLRAVTATLDGEGRRQALELEADIERGDSGAPVLDTDGAVAGMVFATARNQDRGWAVAATELRNALDRLETGPETGPVALAC